MRRFCIKSQQGRTDFLEIITETMDGYRIRLISICDGEKKIREDHITRHLFDICLSTGYISEQSSVEMGFSAA